MEVQNNSVAQFSRWLQRKYPVIYTAVTRRQSLSGMGEDTAPTATVTPTATTGFLDTVTETLKKLLPIGMATYAQKQAIDINIERAKLGQPPIDPTAISPQVNVGINPQQMSQITNIGKIAVFSIIGLGALFLLTKRRRK